MARTKAAKSKRAAIGLSLTCLVALISSGNLSPLKMGLLCAFGGLFLFYGLSGWVTKNGLSFAEKFGRSMILMLAVGLVSGVCAWWFWPQFLQRPHIHVRGISDGEKSTVPGRINLNIDFENNGDADGDVVGEITAEFSEVYQDSTRQRDEENRLFVFSKPLDFSLPETHTVPPHSPIQHSPFIVPIGGTNIGQRGTYVMARFKYRSRQEPDRVWVSEYCGHFADRSQITKCFEHMLNHESFKRLS
jgi:hypothetical protein